MNQYHNVTISGVAGTGSTTLLRLLTERLSPLGWTGYSGGEFMRQFVSHELLEGTHHSAEDYDEEVDRKVDSQIRHQLSHEKHLIIESWLSGFMAQGIPHVLKVLLICSNDLDRAIRLSERDDLRPAKAFKHAYKRLRQNSRRWERMYAAEWDEWVIQTETLPSNTPIFFWHPRLYDLVIDTAVYKPEACLELTLERLGLNTLEPA